MRDKVVANVVLALVVACVAGAIAGYLLWAKRKPKHQAPKKLVPRVLAPVIEPIVDEHVEIVGHGSVRPRVRLEIIPEVSGKVVYRNPNFFSGKTVRKDEILFKIDRTDYEQALRTAKAALALLNAQLKTLDQEKNNLTESEKIERRRLKIAKEKLQRVLELKARGTATDNEVDSAVEVSLSREAALRTILNQLALLGPRRLELEAQIASARAQADQAQTALDRATFPSPVTGRVIDCKLAVGERVQVGSVCGEIYGTELMEVPVSIPAGDLRWMDEKHLAARMRSSATTQPEGDGSSSRTEEPAGGPGRIQARVEWLEAGGPGREAWLGCVDRVEAGLEAQTRTATLVVEVRNGPPLNSGRGMLDLNMFCKVTVTGRKVAKAFVLPRRAVLPDQSVYIVADGKLARREVTVARYSGEEAMILPGGGVREGQRVCIGFVPKPVLGMSVQAIDSLEAPTRPPDGGAAATTRAARTRPGREQ